MYLRASKHILSLDLFEILKQQMKLMATWQNTHHTVMLYETVFSWFKLQVHGQLFLKVSIIICLFNTVSGRQVEILPESCQYVWL